MGEPRHGGADDLSVLSDTPPDVGLVARADPGRVGAGERQRHQGEREKHRHQDEQAEPAGMSGSGVARKWPLPFPSPCRWRGSDPGYGCRLPRSASFRDEDATEAAQAGAIGFSRTCKGEPRTPETPVRQTPAHGLHGRAWRRLSGFPPGNPRNSRLPMASEEKSSMVERTPRREVPRPLPIPRMHVDANSAARFSCFHGGTVIRFAGRPYSLASQEGLSSSKRAGCSSGDSHLLRV